MMAPDTAVPSRTTALNVGSGAILSGRPTFTYLDASAWPVDVAADARHLPFRDEQFDYLQCSHLIEHVPVDEAGGVLRELRRVLSPIGVAYISAPDMDRARAARSATWIQNTKKGGAMPGWEHRWVCTAGRLQKMLVDAGFSPSWATAVPTGWAPNTHSWPNDFEARYLCRRDDYPWAKSFPNGMQVVL